MIKTQIQVPDELYREIRSFARQKEWSLAETFRRGAELMLQLYPRENTTAPGDWQIPFSAEAGWRGLSDEALREAAFTDGEPTLS